MLDHSPPAAQYPYSHLLLTDRGLPLGAQTFDVKPLHLFDLQTVPEGEGEHPVFVLSHVDALPRNGNKPLKEEISTYRRCLNLLGNHDFPVQEGVIGFGSKGAYAFQTIADFPDSFLPQSPFLSFVPVGIDWTKAYSSISVSVGFCSLGLHAVQGVFNSRPRFSGPLAEDFTASPTDPHEVEKEEQRQRLSSEMIRQVPSGEYRTCIPLTSRIIKPPAQLAEALWVEEIGEFLGFAGAPFPSPTPESVQLSPYEMEEIGRLGVLMASFATSQRVDDLVSVYPDVHYRLYYLALALECVLSPEQTSYLFQQMESRRERVRQELETLVQTIQPNASVRGYSILDILKPQIHRTLDSLRLGEDVDQDDLVRELVTTLLDAPHSVTSSGAALLLIEKALEHRDGKVQASAIPAGISAQALPTLLEQLGSSLPEVLRTVSLDDLSNLGFLLDSTGSLPTGTDGGHLGVAVYDSRTERRLAALKRSRIPRVLSEKAEVVVLSSPRYSFRLTERGESGAFGMQSLYGVEKRVLPPDFWRSLNAVQGLTAASEAERRTYFESFASWRDSLDFSYSPRELDDIGGQLLWIGHKLSRLGELTELAAMAYGHSVPSEMLSRLQTLHEERLARLRIELDETRYRFAEEGYSRDLFTNRPHYASELCRLGERVSHHPATLGVLRAQLEPVETYLSILFLDLIGPPPNADEAERVLEAQDGRSISTDTLLQLYKPKRTVLIPIETVHEVYLLWTEVSSLLTRLEQASQKRQLPT